MIGVGLALVVAVGAGAAVSRADEATTAPAAEAWHPSGVGSALAPSRPPGTLHVGAAAGQETDRTYLRFDLSSLPARAEVDTVVVTVPLTADAGTSSPESASVLACAVPGGFGDGGGEEVAPEVVCEGAPAATVTADALTVDVGTLLRGDTLDLALVPGGGDTWHLGFDGRDREGGDPPTATAIYEVPAPSTTTTTTTATGPATGPAGAGPTVTTPPPAAIAMGVPPPAPVALGSVIADEAQVAPPVATASVPVTSSGGGRGFLYPVVFALPIVLVVAVGLVGDGLLRPVTLREERA